MKHVISSCSVAALALACAAGDAAPAARRTDVPCAPLAGELPPDYRDWRLVSVAREEGELDDIRAVLGNDAAIRAFREGRRPFPDGAMLVRLAWSYDSSRENDAAFGRRQSFVAGHPKNGVQLMVKDSVEHAPTGGWEYAQFEDGGPLRDAALIRRCSTCHEAVADRDSVFTRYAR